MFCSNKSKYLLNNGFAKSGLNTGALSAVDGRTPNLCENRFLWQPKLFYISL